MGWLHLPFRRKHWIALKLIHGVYYNLDSKLKKPVRLGPDQEFLKFLRKELENPEKQLLLVVAKTVAEAETWKIDISF